ncbi:uncharacterized protein ARMOST_01197 [Armillaria ostoyae]|uniref:Uncharacterized protein n=1 Tax=Armillaria ostoyae TaxID=47428 RepID=A0A284QNA5_ARMOS|nr:uncharacterized protein ARMOST_01197 [Armillaria ostoyae]
MVASSHSRHDIRTLKGTARGSKMQMMPDSKEDKIHKFGLSQFHCPNYATLVYISESLQAQKGLYRALRVSKDSLQVNIEGLAMTRPYPSLQSSPNSIPLTEGLYRSSAF